MIETIVEKEELALKRNEFAYHLGMVRGFLNRIMNDPHELIAYEKVGVTVHDFIELERAITTISSSFYFSQEITPREEVV